MYDTVKGSDWLGDQDAIHYMVIIFLHPGPIDYAGLVIERSQEGYETINKTSIKYFGACRA